MLRSLYVCIGMGIMSLEFHFSWGQRENTKNVSLLTLATVYVEQDSVFTMKRNWLNDRKEPENIIYTIEKYNK